MIIKSYWRLIKHNYFYKFNKLHLDLLVWVLVKHLLPCYVIKMQQQESGSKKIILSWQLAFKHIWKACFKKHLVQSVYPLSPNFFVKVQCYRSSPFWRHKDLILLIQGLEAVDEDEDKTDEVDEQIEELDKLFSNEIEEKLIETIQEYKEYEANIDPIIVKEPNEM
ncbi:MULE transposase domain protein [Gigaspora margarita]|uniref:MULE transposase domain protein n=1 Tax=Gigaspora margarita TaxID=4874 RepID=A0A8H3XCA4_GIGMA|nr:MULE transposase domain protein [Gigaspora margarita]